MSVSPKKYSKKAIILHWLIGVMVLLALFIGGRMLADIDNSDPEKLSALQGHMIFGLLIGVLMIIRVIVRLTSTRPEPVQTGNVLMDRLGGLVHILLYLLVFAMVGSGMGISILAGLPDIVFQGVGVLPESFSDLPPRMAHGLIANVLSVLIVLHVIAALFHQFKLKDKLMGRMGIGKVE